MYTKKIRDLEGKLKVGADGWCGCVCVWGGGEGGEGGMAQILNKHTPE